MSDKPETLADILAEMRREERPYGISNDRLRSYADRIERAAERERNAHTNDIHDALYMATGIPGNAAAMREALNRVGHLANDLRNITERDTEVRADVNEIVDVCRAALAAPARNCDRPECRTRDEAWKVFERESAGMWAADWDAAFMAWLFAPAEGGAE